MFSFHCFNITSRCIVGCSLEQSLRSWRLTGSEQKGLKRSTRELLLISQRDVAETSWTKAWPVHTLEVLCMKTESEAVNLGVASQHHLNPGSAYSPFTGTLSASHCLYHLSDDWCSLLSCFFYLANEKHEHGQQRKGLCCKKEFVFFELCFSFYPTISPPHTTCLLTTSFLTRASLSVTISLSSAMRCRSSGRLSLFLNFSSVPSNLDTQTNI